jgi:hypothetical protein
MRASQLIGRRLSPVYLAASIVLFSSGVALGSSNPPSSDDVRAYSLGQSYERSFEDYHEPGTCGIVLERQQCRDDFAAVQAFFGSGKMDGEVAAWLKDGDLDNSLTDWDGVMIPDEEWKRDPAFSWWYIAGILSAAQDTPRTTGVDDMVSSIDDLLTKHAAAAPPQFANLIDATGSPSARVKRLITALDIAVPPVAFPSLTLAGGDTGDAQLGVYSSTLQELIDNPMALSRPASRLFALTVIDKLEALDRKLGDSFSFDGIRTHLRGEISGDPDQLNADIRLPLTGWTSMLKHAPAERDAYLFGVMTAQTAYNAAILKDENADSTFLRGVISQTKPYPGMSDAAKSAVLTMQNVPYGKWTDINAAASAATLAIMGE